MVIMTSEMCLLIWSILCSLSEPVKSSMLWSRFLIPGKEPPPYWLNLLGDMMPCLQFEPVEPLQSQDLDNHSPEHCLLRNAISQEEVLVQLDHLVVDVLSLQWIRFIRGYKIVKHRAPVLGTVCKYVH